MAWKGVALLLGCLTLASAEVRISLDSTELDGTWKLRSGNGSVETNGRVPGGVYSDLEDTGVLKTPIFYRLNDQVYKWVGRDNWTYSRNFDLPDEVLNKTVINLVLHGADTIGEVWLNGINIGNVSNMFVRYIFPIKDVVKSTGNSLAVRFTSPVLEADRLFHTQPYLYPPDCGQSTFDVGGECWVNMLRKMPCSFGWDWAPTFPSSGLWKSVEIEATDTAILRDVTVQARKTVDGDQKIWEMTVSMFIDMYVENFRGGIYTRFHYNDGKTVLTATSDVHYKADTQEYVSVLTFPLQQALIDLWWPNGFGEQPTYKIEAVLHPENETLQTKWRNFGFRTIEMIEDRIQPEMEGNTFYVQVNGVPIFAKGANWVPSNILPEKSYNEGHLRNLLLSAKEANMNMLRIWGGGLYESDTFFKIADELGIMILHDFMFSDAFYPVDDGFLSSVRTEVQQQIKRIQHHPSIAYWSGNNENEGALIFSFSNNATGNKMYYDDYRTLYVHTIKASLDVLDPMRYYVTSCFSNGKIEADFDYIHPEPQSVLWGDSHTYDGQTDSWKPWLFPTFRFVSEYGYEGLPSFESLKTVSEPGDWSVSSEFSRWRDRRTNGESFKEMNRLIDFHIPIPPDDGTQENFQKYIYVSQITQAMSTKTVTEKFRRDRDRVDENNYGRTMGALYWMFNDVWQGPTWASVENSGRWKLLHYYAKKFYAPALLSFDVTKDGKIDAVLVSDLTEDLTLLTVYVRVYSFDSLEEKWSVRLDNQKMSAGVGQSVWHADSVDDLISNKAGCQPNTCFIHAELYDHLNKKVSENSWFPSRFHDVSLTNANLKVEITDTSDTEVTLQLTTERIAPFIWLETSEAGIFSDNGFTMTSPEQTITFANRGEKLNVTAFAEGFSYRDLSDATPKKISA